MPTNAFESSRIAEGTMNAGAQHVANRPRQTRHNASPRYTLGTEVIDGHAVKTPKGRRVLGASTLVGAGVRNPAGDSLGKIEDVMIDMTRGTIAYAVLSFGGLFGIGNKFFIVPWSSLSFDQKANEFILDVQKDVLERGPGFERDHWPDLADPAYGTDIHRYYGKKPYWEYTMTDFSSDEFMANRCCE